MVNIIIFNKNIINFSNLIFNLLSGSNNSNESNKPFIESILLGSISIALSKQLAFK